jgi:hypothetical protein
MATVNKDFKIKSGLVVEGTTGTINGYDILTESQASQDFIISVVGGSATSANTPETVVLRDENGDFAAGIVTADLVGDVTGQVSDISNHDTDDLTEGTNNLYFSESRAQVGVSNALGSGLGYGSEGAGNVFYVDTNVIATKTFATDEANAAQQAAVDLAAQDATTKANQAQSNAEQTAAADATTKANAAEQNAEDYADSLIQDSQSSSSTLWSSYKTNTEIGLAEDRAKQHADDAVAELVDAAPEMLNTLNELAAALGDNADFIGTVNAAIGEKVAKAGDTMTGALTLSGAPTSANHAATKAYVDSAESDAISTAAADATSKANAAQAAAEATASADATSKANAAKAAAEATASADATSKANAAQAAAIAHADALTTSDVAEGTAQYFTDARAKASAGDLLAGATKENVEITYVNGILSITAENGVADSNTDQLVEGTTNKYFTDARARAAVDGTTRSFTAVEVNSVAKQVAGTTVVPVAGVATAYSWLKADYRSAEFLVKIANGDHTEVSKVLLTLHANDNISITEYGIVGTNGDLGSVTAAISGNDVQLQVTTANNTSTVTVVGTLLA